MPGYKRMWLTCCLRSGWGLPIWDRIEGKSTDFHYRLHKGSVWLLIIADNTIHLVINGLALRYL
jgi:hypothetical protein